jgi:hypothetical protein
LRCALGIRLRSKVLVGARRTDVLDVDTLAAARERCRVLAAGGSHGSLEALETDRDPEYRHLILEMERVKEGLEQRYGLEEGAVTRTVAESLKASRPQPLERRFPARPWAIPAALAASLLVVILAVQGRTIAELRRDGAVPLVDSPVVWLAPLGERGSPEVQTFPTGTRYVVLLIRPEVLGPRPEGYHLAMFAAGEGEQTALWSGDLSAGELPELFVLVPGSLLAVGDYRLELTGLREGQEIPAGRFQLRVIGGPAGP